MILLLKASEYVGLHSLILTNMKTKKELRNEFKTMKFRAGIVGIVNKMNQKVFVQMSADLDRAFNSDIFQLKAGMHQNSQLQNDWNELGPDAFDFIIIDELNTNATDTPDKINRDLKELLQLNHDAISQKQTLLY